MVARRRRVAESHERVEVREQAVLVVSLSVLGLGSACDALRCVAFGIGESVGQPVSGVNCRGGWRYFMGLGGGGGSAVLEGRGWSERGERHILRRVSKEPMGVAYAQF